MSDFKFACPGCSQRISANDDYVGHQINCPSCQAVIVVPANPSAPPAPEAPSSIAIAAPPGMPPPPAPPKASRLGVSALSSPQAHAPSPSAPSNDPEQQGSATFRAHAARKPKKNYTPLITAVAVIALIAVPAFFGRDWLAAKWKAIRGPSAAEVAAQIAATNAPPPPPELTASEIMAKVVEQYKEMPSFSSSGKIIAVRDMSAINPALAAAGPVTVVEDLTLKMNKPNSFRIDMSIPVGTSNFTAIGWSTGNGSFLQSNNRRTKMPSPGDLYSAFNNGASVGVGDIVDLFIGETNDGLVTSNVEWSRNNDEKLNGQACYVLAGTVKLNNVLVWVSRSSFLIAQTQVVMDGKSGLAAMDDAQIKKEMKVLNNGKEPTLLQIASVKKMAKVTGTITETYPAIQTNVTLAMSDFQPAAPVVAPLQPPQQMQGQGGGAGGGGAPSGGRGGGGGGGRRGR